MEKGAVAGPRGVHNTLSLQNRSALVLLHRNTCIFRVTVLNSLSPAEAQLQGPEKPRHLGLSEPFPLVIRQAGLCSGPPLLRAFILLNAVHGATRVPTSGLLPRLLEVLYLDGLGLAQPLEALAHVGRIAIQIDSVRPERIVTLGAKCGFQAQMP
jgi:hypothetical protein